MTQLQLAVTVGLSAVTVRQLFVLSAIVRSHRFLNGIPTGEAATAVQPCSIPKFFIVLPVLREATILGPTIAHFQAIARQYAADVIVVTTAREADEAPVANPSSDTVALARELAGQGMCLHLHYPDPRGVKADQLNYAAAYCSSTLPRHVSASQAFLVCYDADSRPPRGSLACFAGAIAQHPGADVFHQSSSFESRPAAHTGGAAAKRLSLAICDAGALRANRFVLGFEIPRLLNRSPQASSIKQALCAGVYAHVTGHGLCIRLSLLERLPFPARSPLEDMHYSFLLGSRSLPMVAVPSLDSAEVPLTVSAQIQQAARWFFGPGRFARYLKDPATQRGGRAWLMAASAFGSAAEWVGCAVIPACVLSLAIVGSGLLRDAAWACTAACLAQIVLTEVWLGSPDCAAARLTRLLAFPLACAVHGAGGLVGTARLLTGRSVAGKTERSPAP